MSKQSRNPIMPGTFLRWRKRAVRRVFLVLLGLAAVVAVSYFAYILLHFQLYTGYREVLAGRAYTPAEGMPFAALADSGPGVAGMELAAENAHFKLYTNTATAEVAVFDKRSGEALYSNPPDLQQDPIANHTNMNYLKSQFLLDYYNASRTAGVYDSYSMSVARGQVTAEAIPGGVRYRYELGEKPEITYYVPVSMAPEKLEEIAAALPEADANTIRRAYTLDMDVPGLYGLISTARANQRTLRKLDGILQQAGFTREDYAAQTALGTGETADVMSFVIVLEYRLCDEGLEVCLPVSLMEEHGGGWIYRVQLLRSFAAAGTAESGYMVVPDGAGALIRFNNGKRAAAYSQYIYDIDPMDATYTQLENTVPARLPLYGICRENSSVLATIERGASLCYLTADVAGKYNSYNYIYPSFVLRGFDVLSMFGVSGTEADLPILEMNLYNENITVRYALLNAPYTGYAGLANYYRERLIRQGVLTPRTVQTDLPFFCDVIGGVKETAHTLGVRHLRTRALTTFAQAEQMAEALDLLGVRSQIMNFQGWMNGGVYHDAADRISVTAKLGGQTGLESLSGRLQALGGLLVPDVAFQHVTLISKHYNRAFESARYYGAGYTAILGQVNPSALRRVAALGYPETLYSLLSPKFLSRYVDGFIQAAQPLALTGVSLRDLGDSLHADKRRTEVISREEALTIVTEQLRKLQDTGKKLLVSGGNAYALPYATAITGAPLSSNAYYLVDEAVPLYPMVVHGCLDYAGTPINTVQTDDWQTALLQLIEYGASCRYVFTWQDAAEMKYTGMNRYYATTFAQWKDSAASVYRQLNAALAPVTNARMTGHVRQGDAVKVTYDNGVVLYLNYASHPVQMDGLTLAPMAYRMEGAAL